MLKLFKFRSLGDDESLKRAIGILKTGKFWCSKLWDMNDPMEGVFIHESETIGKNVLGELFNQKNNRVICSFSGARAFKLPTMWGYYANGLKGIAVEIEVRDEDVQKVKYSQKVASWIGASGRATYETRLKRILTTKLTSWRNEDEYRFIATRNTNSAIEIGKIVGVHIGRPYHNIGNRFEVRASSTTMTDYEERTRKLIETANEMKIRCYTAYIDDDEVVSEPFSKSPR